MAFKLNGKTLPIDRGFTHNDITYPRNWLRQAQKKIRLLLVLHGKQTLLGMMTDTTGMVN
jgi:5-bromo-4-chloroindolyl phosphate hydrolysis protein